MAAAETATEGFSFTSWLSFTLPLFTGLRFDRRKMISATHTAMATVATVPHTPVFASAHASAPTTPAAGNVTSHATNILPATPQFTGLPFLPRPVPMMEPEHTCVVDSAKPRCEDTRMVVADAASAAKPRRADFGQARSSACG